MDNALLRAVALLLIADYEGGERLELLLARAGLGYQEIAELVNKKPDAVRMLLKRHKLQG